MGLDAKYPFQVVAEFETREDALAFLELATNDLSVRARFRTQAEVERKESPERERRLGKCILSYMPAGRSVHSSDVAAHLQENGYAANSATSSLSKLTEQGDVRRLGEGYYQKIVNATAPVQT